MDTNTKRRLTYKKRKDAGLCVYCGKVAIQGLIVCEYHREQRRLIKGKYRKKNIEIEKDKNRKRAKRLYNERKKNNECVECGEKAEYGKTRCSYHLTNCAKKNQEYHATHRTQRKKYDEKRNQYRLDNKLCLRCGGKLDTDWDEGCVTCINCREGVARESQRRYV